MDSRRVFYEVRFDHGYVRGGQIVQDTGYVQTAEGSPAWDVYVRYPVEGEFWYAWIPQSNLTPIAAPDAWLADAPR